MPQDHLPSSTTLLRSTLLAAAVAVGLLVTVVLPAEYGVDPTGVGRVLGLTRMGEIKVALAKEAAADAAADSAAAVAAASRGTAASEESRAAVTTAGTSTQDSAAAHTTLVTLQPGEGKEVKLLMRRGGRTTYSWSAEGGVVNFLTHGDTLNAPANAYHTYGRGNGARADSGVIVAVFDGNHGWFWRNRTTGPITVTLKTRGDYRDVLQPK